MEVFYFYYAFSFLFVCGLVHNTKPQLPIVLGLLLAMFGFAVLPVILGYKFADSLNK